MSGTMGIATNIHHRFKLSVSPIRRADDFRTVNDWHLEFDPLLVRRKPHNQFWQIITTVTQCSVRLKPSVVLG